MEGNHAASFDKVFTSTALRTQQTARIACAELGLDSEFEAVEDLLEISMGGFTGQPRSTVYTPEVMRSIDKHTIFFTPDGTSPHDGVPGESQFDVERRMQKFVQSRVLGLCERDRMVTVVVFGHGLAIRCFVRSVLAASDTATVHCGMENTGITELIYDSKDHNLGGWKLIRMNDHAHLALRKLLR